MEKMIRPVPTLRGEISVPGDKSISHRAIMLGAISKGNTSASHFLLSADCLSTISCFRKMGVNIDVDSKGDIVTVHGKGLHSLSKPSGLLYTGNSGTTTRLIAGILAGQKFDSVLDGDSSIRKRPMNRIIIPLRQMGALIESGSGNGCAPLSIHQGALHGIDYHSPVSSAQVKSCVLLAGLYADSETSVTENALSRNHTELMLEGFGAKIICEKRTVHTKPSPRSIEVNNISPAGSTDISPARPTNISPAGSTDISHVLWKATVQPDPALIGQRMYVPGDISSAAYFIAAALIVNDSEVLVRGVGINPTRAGFLEVVRRMGGHVKLLNERTQGGEKVADILAASSSLQGTVIEGDIIPTLIDELPICAVLASYADGKTIVRNAEELKVKESDRIITMARAMSAMGSDIIPTNDGWIIEGGHLIHGAKVDSEADHRVAMSLAVAALAAQGETIIKDATCVDISYPGFYKDLLSLSANHVC